MLNFIDGILNKITMYRVVLYYLIALAAIAAVFGFFGILPYSPGSILVSILILVFVCWATNNLFAGVFDARPNSESFLITALILALIITPIKIQPFDFGGAAFLVWAGVWAMASKFILAVRGKHIFNPAAFAVALTAFTIGESATWWVGGNVYLLPFVLAGGLLVARKIQRFDLAASFSIAALAAIVWTQYPQNSPFSVLTKALLHAPILFFAFVMITEPLTAPPTRNLRMLYAALVGILFAPAMHIGSIYSTPELVLLLGNVFSYLVSPKFRGVLTLEKKESTGLGTYDFVFAAAGSPVSFRPGQYMEWTLPHSRSDSRGNRRYFTIASSPTENELRIGVKFYPNASSFKRSMIGMKRGDKIGAGQLAGDFVLPRNAREKLVFMAGGIGITPFRSMIKYLVDKNEKRTVTLLYSNNTESEIAYRELFDEAERRLGIKTIYALTDIGSIPPSWKGQKGYIDERLIAREIPDYRERIFYLSGPHSFVTAFQKILKRMGVPQRHIKTDFFPGFA